MKRVALILSTLFFLSWMNERPSVDILCYHAFLNNKNPYCFSVEELESHIQFFKQKGFQFVTFNDVVHNRINGNKNILITIDDGNRTVYEAYKKVFRPHNIKPVLAIYPCVIGRKKYALTWNQLKELSDYGCVIAAHGYYHRKLNSRLYRRERYTFKKEIAGSKRILESKLGRRINVFAYPYGVFSGEALEFLSKEGFKYAFTIQSSSLKLPFGATTSHLQLPRYMITRSTWRGFSRLIARGGRFRKADRIARSRIYKKKIERKIAVKTKIKPQLKTQLNVPSYVTLGDDVHKASLKLIKRIKSRITNDYLPLNLISKKESSEIGVAQKDNSLFGNSENYITSQNYRVAPGQLTGSASEDKNQGTRKFKKRLRKEFVRVTDKTYRNYASYMRFFKKRLLQMKYKITKLFD